MILIALLCLGFCRTTAYILSQVKKDITDNSTFTEQYWLNKANLTEEDRGIIGRRLRDANFRALARGTEIYRGDCRWTNYTPSSGRPAGTRLVYFVHGMGGAPCQYKIPEASLLQKWRDYRIFSLAAGGDVMGDTKLPFPRRYTREAIQGRKELIFRDLVALQSIDEGAEVNVFVSSNGMYDLINAYEYLEDRQFPGGIRVFWAAVMDDSISAESLGVIGSLLNVVESIIPHTVDPRIGVLEEYIPVSVPGMSRLNEEFKLRFRGPRLTYDWTAQSFSTQNDYVYDKTIIESRFKALGVWWSANYPIEWYIPVYEQQLRYVRENNKKLPYPVCALVPNNDGYWTVTPDKINTLLDRYFSRERTWMGKNTGHMFVINTGIVSEWLDFADHTISTYDPDQIYGHTLAPFAQRVPNWLR